MSHNKQWQSDVPLWLGRIGLQQYSIACLRMGWHTVDDLAALSTPEARDRFFQAVGVRDDDRARFESELSVLRSCPHPAPSAPCRATILVPRGSSAVPVSSPAALGSPPVRPASAEAPEQRRAPVVEVFEMAKGQCATLVPAEEGAGEETAAAAPASFSIPGTARERASGDRERVAYVVRCYGAHRSSREAHKRFRDFKNLYRVLYAEYSYAELPRLPPRKEATRALLGAEGDDGAVERLRMRRLESFLNRAARLPREGRRQDLRAWLEGAARFERPAPGSGQPEREAAAEVQRARLEGSCGALDLAHLDGETIAELQFSALRSLRAAWAGVRAVPAAVLTLAGLEVLDLTGNDLEELPAEVAGLACLRELRLGWNRLRRLPDLSALRSLGVLVVQNNLLRQLHVSLAALPYLAELDAGGNPLASVVVAAHCNALRRLCLESCGIAALPPEMRTLTALEDLDLGGNRLARLSPGVGALARLRRLNLSDNRLTRLPAELAACAQLAAEGSQLELVGNPLEDEQLVEAYAEGTASLFAYLRTLPPSEPEPEPEPVPSPALKTAHEHLREPAPEPEPPEPAFRACMSPTSARAAMSREDKVRAVVEISRENAEDVAKWFEAVVRSADKLSPTFFPAVSRVATMMGINAPTQLEQDGEEDEEEEWDDVSDSMRACACAARFLTLSMRDSLVAQPQPSLEELLRIAHTIRDALVFVTEHPVPRS
eukprot:m51a1_g3078 hypothetical protein (719) ;mRNA; r:50366-52701